jgi:5-methyltetrahydropteroyltriglutamate--homocysteine methyltransferase
MSYPTTILGYPRIGRDRELKKSLEAYWKGECPAEALENTAATLRAQHWQEIAESGITYIPSGDFSLYDQTLDQIVALGALPQRYIDATETPLDAYFAAARGVQQETALEMTKWFNTNYHYIVPEFTPDQTFSAHPEKYVRHYQEAKALGIETRPVLIGPISFLKLGKVTDGSDPLALLDALLPAYIDVLHALSNAGATWVQLDEPFLVHELSAEDQNAYAHAYRLLRRESTLKHFVATYFGDIGEHASWVARLPIDGLHIDATETSPATVAQLCRILPESVVLSYGAISGRNIWKHDLASVLDALQALDKEQLWLGASCSLLHVPYDVSRETELPKEVFGWLSFARQKLTELSALATGDRSHSVITDSRDTIAARAASSRIHRPEVKRALDSVSDAWFTRAQPYSTRKRLQAQQLKLPLFPTTTIGSFPQTTQVRKARAGFRNGSVSEASYTRFLEEATTEAIRIQEALDIDVLVHGEFERNDMVEYFGEHLEGFAFTRHGWVQSYGSRCVKPPIIYGDVARKGPITVAWSAFAQSQTSRPVKGMLTGPVTILKWSFVRDDQPLSVTCNHIALALRDEVADLEAANIRVIQIDEPALREGLPLRKTAHAAYLDWAVRAFKLASSGVADATQIHTHMCYADFADIIAAIADLDADVISIETSRSQMELLDTFKEFVYPNAIGPGVYDIHSPRIPTTDEITSLLTSAAKYIDPTALWVNPDCGLKTRGWPEVKEALAHMVEAAKTLRAQYASEGEARCG